MIKEVGGARSSALVVEVVNKHTMINEVAEVAADDVSAGRIMTNRSEIEIPR